MPTVAQLLSKGKNLLQSVSDSYELDTTLLLAKALSQTRTSVYAWPEKIVDDDKADYFFELIAERQKGKPIAYILCVQEFWSLPIKVNNNVLIPRADTEILVELAINLSISEDAKVLDLGTGSGAIALALAKEKPNWQIFAVDNSSKALEVAKDNAKSLKLTNIIFQRSDWFTKLANNKFSCIISNPPYIAENDRHLEKLIFEPREALVSAKKGVADLEKIIFTAINFLEQGGYLIVEHSYDQSLKVEKIFSASGFNSISTHYDLAGKARCTMGKK